MDASFIRGKIKKNDYDLSAHAHPERQEEQITLEEIEKILLIVTVYRPKLPVWLDYKTRAKEVKSRV